MDDNEPFVARVKRGALSGEIIMSIIVTMFFLSVPLGIYGETPRMAAWIFGICAVLPVLYGLVVISLALRGDDTAIVIDNDAIRPGLFNANHIPLSSIASARIVTRTSKNNSWHALLLDSKEANDPRFVPRATIRFLNTFGVFRGVDKESWSLSWLDRGPGEILEAIETRLTRLKGP